jgi:GT2 family glycosyltransferase
MMNPKVSIIILNYNGSKFIEGCLSSVLKTDYPNFEVILVDNASKDGSLEIARRLFGKDPRLKIVRNDENLGFAEGNNVGARHARGDILVFLNEDTEVDPNWLKELVKVLISDTKVGAAQCKILMAHEKHKIESVGHYLDYCGIESWASAKVFKETDLGQYDRIREIFYAKGAAMGVKRHVFFEAGGFDPAYFIDHEEIDLCWRIRLLGYKILFVPNSIVYHYGGAFVGRREENLQILFHLRKNHIMSLMKNYELKNLAKYLPMYLAFLFLHGVYLALRGKLYVPLTYLKSLLWILKNFKYIYSQRLRVQLLVRVVPDSVIMKCMTKPRVPWHFLK